LSKKDINGNLLSPLPIILVEANVKDKPNYLVIGYACPFDFGKYIFFSLYKKRYTSQGIHESMTFSVNIPNEDIVMETNICGTKSGRDLDKSSIFDNFYGLLESAPMIRECPINIECEVTEIIDHELNEGIIGKVVESYVNPNCLDGENIDWRKVHPIIWATGGDYNYYKLGDRLEIKE
jgi:flavin reductase (DIM6/NTAB) family NADH-FMN oxidoreductase RutF